MSRENGSQRRKAPSNLKSILGLGWGHVHFHSFCSASWLCSICLHCRGIPSKRYSKGVSTGWVLVCICKFVFVVCRSYPFFSVQLFSERRFGFVLVAWKACSSQAFARCTHGHRFCGWVFARFLFTYSNCSCLVACCVTWLGIFWFLRDVPEGHPHPKLVLVSSCKLEAREKDTIKPFHNAYTCWKKLLHHFCCWIFDSYPKIVTFKRLASLSGCDHNWEVRIS